MKIKEKVLEEPVTEEEHKDFMELFGDEFGHPTEIPSEFGRMIAFSRHRNNKILAETEKEIERLKEKIKDLEYDLLAYRRPVGTSVVNVREDEKKKTLAEVGKMIKLNAQRCYKEINLTTIPKNEVIFLCWCNRIDELMLMYAELKGCSVVQANKECGIDYYKLEELKTKLGI